MSTSGLFERIPSAEMCRGFFLSGVSGRRFIAAGFCAAGFYAGRARGRRRASSYFAFPSLRSIQSCEKSRQIIPPVVPLSCIVRHSRMQAWIAGRRGAIGPGRSRGCSGSGGNASRIAGATAGRVFSGTSGGTGTPIPGGRGGGIGTSCAGCAIMADGHKAAASASPQSHGPTSGRALVARAYRGRRGDFETVNIMDRSKIPCPVLKRT